MRGAELSRSHALIMESIDAGRRRNLTDNRFGEPEITRTTNVHVEHIELVILPRANVHHAIEVIALVDRDAVLLNPAIRDSRHPREKAVVIACRRPFFAQARWPGLRTSDVNSREGIVGYVEVADTV